jgi:bifunctional non-homologous end joining protein LigD
VSADERPLNPKPRKPPAFVTPMAAVTVKKLPDGDEWLYELKWDGYRALLIKDGDIRRVVLDEVPESGPILDVWLHW